jgi:hypothetical protein
MLTTTKLLLEGDMSWGSFQPSFQYLLRFALELLRRQQHRRLALIHDILQLMCGEGGGEWEGDRMRAQDREESYCSSCQCLNSSSITPRRKPTHIIIAILYQKGNPLAVNCFYPCFLQKSVLCLCNVPQ